MEPSPPPHLPGLCPWQPFSPPPRSPGCAPLPVPTCSASICLCHHNTPFSYRPSSLVGPHWGLTACKVMGPDHLDLHPRQPVPRSGVQMAFPLKYGETVWQAFVPLWGSPGLLVARVPGC